MAVVSQRQKWLYVMEPHTASRAVHSALMDSLTCGPLGHHHADVLELTNKRKRGRVPLLNNVEDWDLCCTVRNPFDVLVTMYRTSAFGRPVRTDEELLIDCANDPRALERLKKHNERNKTTHVPFGEWVLKAIHAGSDAICVPLRGMWRECNNFCYYEHLQEDLDTMFNGRVKIGFDEKHVTADKGHWSEWWVGEKEQEALRRLLPYYFSFLDQFGYEVTWDGSVPPVVTVNEEVRGQRCRKIALL